MFESQSRELGLYRALPEPVKYIFKNSSQEPDVDLLGGADSREPAKKGAGYPTMIGILYIKITLLLKFLAYDNIFSLENLVL